MSQILGVVVATVHIEEHELHIEELEECLGKENMRMKGEMESLGAEVRSLTPAAVDPPSRNSDQSVEDLVQ